MGLRTELESLSASELIDALSIRIYEPPLCVARERLREIAEPLRVLILIIDFDTEVCMNGMVGFLENSTGLYLSETIEAFDMIGAGETAGILRKIERTMQRHGVSPTKLRADFAGTQEFQITTFRELHGDLQAMIDEIEVDSKRLYFCAEPGSDKEARLSLEPFVERHRQELLEEVHRF